MAFEPNLVEARLALRLIGPDEMPALACDVLEAGLDGLAIRRVASLIQPSGWETDQILPKFMAEAGLRSITRREASIRLAGHLARRILANGLDPVQHTRDFELLWIEADYPVEIQEAGCLDDERYLAETGGQSVAEFREYARGVLEALASADNSDHR